MSGQTKTYTIYVSLSDEPCASCGAAPGELKGIVLPMPETEPKTRTEWVLRDPPGDEGRGYFDRYKPVETVDWAITDQHALRCKACRAVHLFGDDDGEREVTFPVRLEVCGRCEGTGYHLTPSIGEHAYSMEEFHESFDEDEADEYFKRGGIYDVVCFDCKGRNVVPVVDEEACARDATGRLARDLALAHKHWEAEGDARAEQAAELRMERMMCGDY